MMEKVVPGTAPALGTRSADLAEFPDLLALVLTVDHPGGQRWQNAKHETEKVALLAEFVRGYGSDDPRAARDYSRVRNLLHCRRSLTSGEIAVYAGHRKMWRRLIDSGHDLALIIEDDLQIRDVPAFRRAIADCLTHSDDWDIIKFFDYRPKRVERQKSISGTRLVRYKYAASGAVCYLLSRDAAMRLLSRKAFFRPVDEDFSWHWELGLDIWSVDPNPVAEVADRLGGSLLEEGRIESRRIRRPVRALSDIFRQGYKQIMARLHG